MSYTYALQLKVIASKLKKGKTMDPDKLAALIERRKILRSKMIKQYNKKYYALHAEERRSYQRNYYHKHASQMNQYKKEYRAKKRLQNERKS